MRETVIYRVPWLLAVALVAAACSSDDPKPGADAPEVPPATTAKAEMPAAPAPTAQADAPKAKPSDTATDPSFTMQLKPAGEYTAGELGTLVLDLTPRAPYHVNQEFPITVKLKAPPGLSLPKTELQKADAAAFGEDKARFEVPFTPDKAGEYLVEAHVRFAVCTPETCVPDERDLALAVAVK